IEVQASSDDARSSDHDEFLISEPSMLVGGGNGVDPNVAGFRFLNVPVPPSAIIDAVEFSLVKSGSEWRRFVVELGFEATDDAPAFSSAAPPALRARTAAAAQVDSNVRWTSGQRYIIGDVGDIAEALQEVISRPGWRAGQDLAVIAYGPAAARWDRLTFFAFDAQGDSRPRLEITYHLPTDVSTSTPTPTVTEDVGTATPTSTVVSPESMTLVTTTTPPNDARSDGAANFSADDRVVPVGSGNGNVPNIIGFRFTDVSVPRNATITSVELSLLKWGSQWNHLVVDLGFEASGDAAPFTSAAAPVTRSRTSTVDQIDVNTRWTGETRYQFGDPTILAAALQEVVNRADWRAGNSLALIAHGPASPAWARLYFYAADAGAAFAPTLTVTFAPNSDDPPPPATPTQTATATPTATSTPTPTPTP
ncbi:MAG: hypothetical protein ACRD1H_00325, partial [Vicinamibacterales bacterium]